jgi:hypothetical protein
LACRVESEAKVLDLPAAGAQLELPPPYIPMPRCLAVRRELEERAQRRSATA